MGNTHAVGARADLPADDVVEVTNPAGAGKFVLVCEHASNHIPAEFNNLGLSDHDLANHIAWDPGALEVARTLSALLDAPLVEQHVSRLLYDCNRPPAAQSAMSVESEFYEIPGNVDLSKPDRQMRVRRFYEPFRAALSACLDQRRDPVIVTIHSFTPVFMGKRRDVDIGILHDHDTRFADAVLDCAAHNETLIIRRNAPYGPKDGVTHTLVEHGIARGLLNVMIEIRHDLIADTASQSAMAKRLSRWVLDALAKTTDGAARKMAGVPANKPVHHEAAEATGAKK
ncbi:MAG: N-formylglutamate amidohydrolase [Alphaproteobacteria bacterium]